MIPKARANQHRMDFQQGQADRFGSWQVLRNPLGYNLGYTGPKRKGLARAIFIIHRTAKDVPQIHPDSAAVKITEGEHHGRLLYILYFFLSCLSAIVHVF